MATMSSNVKVPLLAGVLASLGASVCCVGPLVLLSLGVGGAWISHLTRFEPYRPLFIGLTLLFLLLAFRRLHFAPRACAPGTPCADKQTRNNQRLLFWITASVLLALLAAPWVISLFYR
ncbi:mercuric transporter MerT family protein [Edaphobacter bradus]|uniref:mercuric transporter MerT family protein n=1 Tax=Edaphobacter bradus TaxID=2259016 RepID=UPI0021DFEBB3|nr:mercuric transporter MerT family protein [Edaphobacter bradus]